MHASCSYRKLSADAAAGQGPAGRPGHAGCRNPGNRSHLHCADHRLAVGQPATVGQGMLSAMQAAGTLSATVVSKAWWGALCGWAGQSGRRKFLRSCPGLRFATGISLSVFSSRSSQRRASVVWLSKASSGCRLLKVSLRPSGTPPSVRAGVCRPEKMRLRSHLFCQRRRLSMSAGERDGGGGPADGCHRCRMAPVAETVSRRRSQRPRRRSRGRLISNARYRCDFATCSRLAEPGRSPRRRRLECISPRHRRPRSPGRSIAGLLGTCNGF